MCWRRVACPSSPSSRGERWALWGCGSSWLAWPRAAGALAAGEVAAAPNRRAVGSMAPASRASIACGPYFGLARSGWPPARSRARSAPQRPPPPAWAGGSARSPRRGPLAPRSLRAVDARSGPGWSSPWPALDRIVLMALAAVRDRGVRRGRLGARRVRGGRQAAELRAAHPPARERIAAYERDRRSGPVTTVPWARRGRRVGRPSPRRGKGGAAAFDRVLADVQADASAGLHAPVASPWR